MVDALAGFCKLSELERDDKNGCIDNKCVSWVERVKMIEYVVVVNQVNPKYSQLKWFKI